MGFKVHGLKEKISFLEQQILAQTKKERARQAKEQEQEKLTRLKATQDQERMARESDRKYKDEERRRQTHINARFLEGNKAREEAAMREE